MLEPLFDQSAHVLDVEGLLGDQGHVRAGRQARVQGDPAGVAAHDLDDEHAVVRLGGRVQAVDRVGGDLCLLGDSPAGEGGDAIRVGLGSVWLSNISAGNVWRLDPRRIAATLAP